MRLSRSGSSRGERTVVEERSIMKHELPLLDLELRHQRI